MGSNNDGIGSRSAPGGSRGRLVAAQDGEDLGVLVLSSLAGAAQELSGALLVNPYDNAAVALALQQALAMPLAEQRSRQESMLNSLRANTISDWHESFVSRLTA